MRKRGFFMDKTLIHKPNQKVCITEDMVMEQWANRLAKPEPEVPEKPECPVCPEKPECQEKPMCPEMCECRACLPYPDPCATCQNMSYVRLLKVAYAGMSSEFTAVGQYFYASCRLRTKNLEAYKAFKYIAVVEMEHMEMLAKLIGSLGGDERFCAPTPRGEQYWSGAMVKYSKSPCAIVLDAIEAEKAAIAGYKRICTIIKDEKITCVLKRIIMDEEVHLKIFEDLYKKMR